MGTRIGRVRQIAGPVALGRTAARLKVPQLTEPIVCAAVLRADRRGETIIHASRRPNRRADRRPRC